VSIKFTVFGSVPGGQSSWRGQWNVMAADWIVMPLARSSSRKSVTVFPASTSATSLEGRGSLMEELFTSHSLRDTTIVKHALCCGGFALQARLAWPLTPYPMGPNRVNVRDDADIARIFKQRIMRRILDLAVKSCNDERSRWLPGRPAQLRETAPHGRSPAQQRRGDHDYDQVVSDSIILRKPSTRLMGLEV
jgi:hypothetical protein